MASPEEMAAKMIASLREKTGKTMPQWTKVLQQTGLAKHGEMVKLLKAEHGVTHGYANLIANQFRQGDTGSSASVDLVDAQYEGDKAALRPIYQAIVDAVTKFGSDVEVSPKKSYVSLRRKKQFALIQPSTKTRVDLGINLKDVDPEGALEASGSFNTMVSHRVRLESKKDVNAAVKKWLKAAYQSAG